MIWSCVIDQHYIRCALAGDTSLQAMAMSIQDALYPSAFDYHLPESLAAACELSHDLYHLKEFDPDNVFTTEHVLRHNFGPRIDPYSDGNYDYSDDCHFLDAFESPEQGKACAPDCLRPGEKWMIDGHGATIEW